MFHQKGWLHASPTTQLPRYLNVDTVIFVFVILITYYGFGVFERSV